MSSVPASAGVFWGLLAAVWMIFVFGFLLPERARLARTRGQKATLAREYRTLAQENARLAAGLERLTLGDPALWEREIRDRLGWVGAGEVPVSDQLMEGEVD